MAGYSGRSLAAKLGIKSGHRVAAIKAPPGYRTLLGPLPDGIAFSRRRAGNVDVIHVFVSSRVELERELARWRQIMPDAAVLWISWPKKTSGVSTDVTEDVIREVAIPLGLVDTKVCAVDDVWSGLKLVIRLANRGGARR